MPVELARLEAAVLAAVAREAAGVPVDQVAHQLQVAPPLGRAGGDDLRLEQPVEAEQRPGATAPPRRPPPRTGTAPRRDCATRPIRPPGGAPSRSPAPSPSPARRSPADARARWRRAALRRGA